MIMPGEHVPVDESTWFGARKDWRNFPPHCFNISVFSQHDHIF